MIESFERCYAAVQSKDQRFDGWFFTAVTSTGIYCRPSCPAITPKRRNVRFFKTAAAAQEAGFRACKRCRPDAAPGSPEWDHRADAVGRAMRLIADGLVDREGVPGLASALGYSERHLHRMLRAEVGSGPLALARAQRAQTARILIETTSLPLASVAFAAGFASVRQFNDTVRTVFATTPSQLRVAAAKKETPAADALTLRLALRQPMDAGGSLAFLGARAVPGVETVAGDTYARTLRLPHGNATVALRAAERHIACRLRLDDLRDLTAAVQRCRTLLDLDADPVAVDDHLRQDPLLAPLVAARPGLRVPGAVDGDELAVRAVLGQQVSVAAARTLAGRLVEAFGKPLTTPAPGASAAAAALTHTFPTTEVLADADLSAIGMPVSRRVTLQRLCEALAERRVVLSRGSDWAAARAQLLELPGIGPWTAEYIAMRALGDPDALPLTDLGLRRAFERAGQPSDARSIAASAERWRPWRSYALLHLWMEES